MKSQIFLSYSHRDKYIAQQLHTGLTARGLDVWIDESELFVGDPIMKSISSAIAEAQFVVALLSPNSERSPWCEKELSLALTAQLKKKGVRILPIRFGGATIPESLTDTYCLDLDPKKVSVAVAKIAEAAMRHSAENAIAEELSEGSERRDPTATRAFPALRTPADVERTPSPARRWFTTARQQLKTLWAPWTPAELDGYDEAAESADPIHIYARQPLPSTHATMSGKVKWFNSDRGWGFLSPDDDGPDIFVHYTAIQMDGFRTLVEGQGVLFHVELSERGPQARQVVISA